MYQQFRRYLAKKIGELSVIFVEMGNNYLTNPKFWKAVRWH